MLDQLKLDADVVQEVEKDTVGGGGPLASNIYDLTLKAAYFDVAKSKAVSVNLLMETSTGRRLNVTEYITSGEAKGCKPYYEKDGKKFPLPGYAKMNTLCQLLTGKTIDQLTAEPKILKLYDFEARAEVNKEKNVIVELTGTVLRGGVLRVIEDKRVRNPSTGAYEPNGEKRTINEVDKFFAATGHTLDEKLKGGEAAFQAEWLKANEGKDRDKSSKTSVAAGAPALGGTAAGTPALNFT